MGGEGEKDRATGVINQQAWVTALFVAMTLVGLAGGVTMTIASGGRPDTPLTAFGPIGVLFGLVSGYLALSSWHGQVAVIDDSYSVRQGIASKTTTMRMSDAAMVRGGVGDSLGYVVITDRQGHRIRFSLRKGTVAMRQHVAERLLASSADIDPESLYALRQLAGPAVTSDDRPDRGPYVRWDSNDRPRWRRGTGLSFFRAAMLVGGSLIFFLAAAPGVPRAWGLLPLALGVVQGAVPIYGRHVDSKQQSGPSR